MGFQDLAYPTGVSVDDVTIHVSGGKIQVQEGGISTKHVHGFYTASETEILANIGADSTSSMTYVEVVGKNVTGVSIGSTLRIKWNLKAQTADTAYSKVYIDGVAVGVEKSTTQTTNQPQIDNVTVPAFTGGGFRIGIYAKSLNGGAKTAYIEAPTTIHADLTNLMSVTFT